VGRDDIRRGQDSGHIEVSKQSWQESDAMKPAFFLYSPVKETSGESSAREKYTVGKSVPVPLRYRGLNHSGADTRQELAALESSPQSLEMKPGNYQLTDPSLGCLQQQEENSSKVYQGRPQQTSTGSPSEQKPQKPIRLWRRKGRVCQPVYQTLGKGRVREREETINL